MIKDNPFTSDTFIEVWCKHFNTYKDTYAFKILKGISFFKPSKLPLYINTGHSLTKGMSYDICNHDKLTGLNKKACLIYDVPQYFEIDNSVAKTNIKFKKIKQYPGFLINLENYNDFTHYFKSTFSKSSVQKLNRYNRRLETCFDIKETMLLGPDVNKLDYEFVFKHFHELLTKRFEDKQITNNNLNPEEWLFYKDVAYPLILDNKAALHVIYNGDIPISVRLLYFSENIIFDAITVFDIDYAKFHIGKVSIMKMLQWSFNSNYKIFDFSKGYFDYKESWSDLKYNFEYHIYYDAANITSNIIASSLSCFYKLKQYLRDKEVNNKLHKATYFLKKKPTNNNIELLELQAETISFKKEDLAEINIFSDYDYLKKHLFDFAFLSSNHINNIQTFKINNQTKDCFFFKAPKQSIIIGVQN